MSNFKPGELVVYPSRGVGVVDRVTRKQVGEFSADFYVLNFAELTILVPAARADQLGMRAASTEVQAREALRIAKVGDARDLGPNWHQRYLKCTELLKTGKLADVARVYRSLTVLRVDKDLSFGERKMLDHAKDLLVQESTLVLGETPSFGRTA